MQLTKLRNPNMKKTKKDLLDVLKLLCDKERELSSIFGDSDYLSDAIEIVGDIIGEQLGVPEDTTLTEEIGSPKYQCNDLWYEYIYGFADGDMDKKVMLRKIKKLNERAQQ
jgi:hypothetical protein